MPQYRKKPIVISAVEFKKDDPTTHEGVNFGAPEGDGIYAMVDGKYWIRTAAGGVEIVDDGDFIVTGTQGERYPVKPAIFAEIYEPVEETPAAEAPAPVETPPSREPE